MRFPEEFITELKSRVRLSDVIGRKVKLKKQGKDWVGLSPFSNEKTPSFHVHDDRGFYKCFSTGNAGDAITYLMETERLSFSEAVEKLARDVGLELPAENPQEQQNYRRRATLLDWVEKAAAWYEQQLRGPQGGSAREYLIRRGFGPEAWTRHRLGFAPDGWRNLSDHLTRQGANVAELVEAGLLVEPEDGAAPGRSKAPWDRFRNRVIFPISDPQGRVIAFGARTLEPDGKPKYLNSSDSPLFHKGRTLFRYGPAREALAKEAEGRLSRGLVVTEGYVDAIAMAEAGMGTAVAPLGTALTEDQIEMLWRAGPEPILCFDGDAAGLRAAHKAVDRALPLIEPGRTLYFALLPDGLDPDDMIRQRGAQALRDLLLAAQPLVDLLWMRELEAAPLDTPEAIAGFEDRLSQAAATIRHAAVRRAYERELRNRFFQHTRSQRAAPPAFQPRPERTLSPRRAPPDRLGRIPGSGRLGITAGPAPHAGLGLLVRAIETPDLLELAREALIHSDFADPDVAAIRDAAFHVLDSGESLDRGTVAAHLRKLGRARSEKLLNDYLRAGPLDLASGDWREWVSALERFRAAAAVSEETKGVVRDGESEAGVARASHETRLKAVIAERERALRPSPDLTADGAMQGAHELRSALVDMNEVVKRKFSDG